MSRITAIFTVLITWTATSPWAEAQREIHHVPPVVSPEGNNPDYFSPFMDPMAFKPDFQFFAPADFDTFGSCPEPKIGWFATYDRVRIWVTRPEHVQSYTEGDFTWGNRFDVGYMTEEDHGWLFSITHIDGPNASDVVTRERINVYEEDDQINSNPNNTVILRGGGGTTGGTTTTNPQIPGVPIKDRNLRDTGQRDYQLHDTLNVADITSWELNKTLRLDTLHYGSIVEPFAGFRYIKFVDLTRFDLYGRFDEDTGLEIPIGPNPPIRTDIEDQGTIERLTIDQSTWDNHMIGGQLGLRWYKQKSRWDLSGEVRAFALQNFQSFHRTIDVETTYYDGTAIGDDVIAILDSRSGFSDHASEIVVGAEVRAEAAYAISRDISLRAGVAFLEFGRGIARGSNPLRNDEDVTMIGYTFGATINR